MTLFTTLLVFMLLAYGWTNIMVFGSLFDKWRERWDSFSPNFFGKLFSCPMCLGTWVGFLLSATFQTLGWHTPMEMYGVEMFWAAIFLDGILTSGCVWIMHTIQEWFEYRPNA